MSPQSKVATYQNASATLQKTKQIVMLYDALIRFVQQARKAIEDKDYEERLNLIQKASNIIIGLHGSLDFENGGEISEFLAEFYSATDMKLLKINQTNSLQECDNIVEELKAMREAWAQVDVEQVKSQDNELPAAANAEISAPVEKTDSTDFEA